MKWPQPCRVYQVADINLVHPAATKTARHIQTDEDAMKAADVMTPDPVCISPDTSIIDAARLMLERKFSGLPVVDAGGRLVGIVTEGDLLRRTETGTQPKRARWIEFLMGSGRLATEYAQTRGRKVSDVMTSGGAKGDRGCPARGGRSSHGAPSDQPCAGGPRR